MRYPQLSHRLAVNNLLLHYPLDAFEFLVPDLWASRGRPGFVDPIHLLSTRESPFDKGQEQVTHLSLRFGFEYGRAVLVVVYQQRGNAFQLDLLPAASHYLDILRRFPEDEILPIVLFDDDRAAARADTFVHGAAGDSYLIFRTRIVQIRALELARFWQSRNRIALSFSPGMVSNCNRIDKVLRVAMAFRDLGDCEGLYRHFGLWVEEGRLSVEEQKELNRRMKEDEMSEIIDWWVQEGFEDGFSRGRSQANKESARRMLERGCHWEFITEITEVRPEDLPKD